MGRTLTWVLQECATALSEKAASVGYQFSKEFAREMARVVFDTARNAPHEVIDAGRSVFPSGSGDMMKAWFAMIDEIAPPELINVPNEPAPAVEYCAPTNHPDDDF